MTLTILNIRAAITNGQILNTAADGNAAGRNRVLTARIMMVLAAERQSALLLKKEIGMNAVVRRVPEVPALMGLFPMAVVLKPILRAFHNQRFGFIAAGLFYLLSVFPLPSSVFF